MRRSRVPALVRVSPFAVRILSARVCRRTNGSGGLVERVACYYLTAPLAGAAEFVRVGVAAFLGPVFHERLLHGMPFVSFNRYIEPHWRDR